MELLKLLLFQKQLSSNTLVSQTLPLKNSMMLIFSHVSLHPLIPLYEIMMLLKLDLRTALQSAPTHSPLRPVFILDLTALLTPFLSQKQLSSNTLISQTLPLKNSTMLIFSHISLPLLIPLYEIMMLLKLNLRTALQSALTRSPLQTVFILALTALLIPFLSQKQLSSNILISQTLLLKNSTMLIFSHISLPLLIPLYEIMMLLKLDLRTALQSALTRSPLQTVFTLALTALLTPFLSQKQL